MTNNENDTIGLAAVGCHTKNQHHQIEVCGKSGKFPIPSIWKHLLPSPNSVPPTQDWPLPIPSRLSPENETGIPEFEILYFQFLKCPKFSTAGEFSCWVLKIVIQTRPNKTRETISCTVFFFEKTTPICLVSI